MAIVVFLIIFSVQFVGAYDNAAHGFSINFPSGWEQTQNPDVVVLYVNDDGSASINIIVEETSASLSDYVAASKTQLADLDYYELISEKSRTIGGLGGYELVYAWTLYDGDDSYDLQDKQVFFVQNGKAYIITCGADYYEYDSVLPTFEQTLESFRLTQTGTPATLNSNLIVGAIVIAVIVVLAIAIVVLWRRKRQPPQRQFDSTGTGTLYPPPPPPPPPP